jgi:hypothetical protein
MDLFRPLRELFGSKPQKTLAEEARERLDELLPELRAVVRRVPPPPTSPSPEEGRRIIADLTRIALGISALGNHIRENIQRADKSENDEWVALSGEVAEARALLFSVIDPEEVSDVLDRERGDGGPAT